MPRFGIALIAAASLACSTGSEPGEPDVDQPAATTTLQGVEFRAETRVLESFPVQLRTSVEMTNRSGAAVALTFPDGCVVLLRAYREAGAAAVWDQGSVLSCTAALVEVRLAAGETRTFEARTDARAILGASLPDGRYRLEVYLRPRSGVIAVEAGTVDLAVPR
jgi:hypothetical protein